MYMFCTKEKGTVYKLISWRVQCSKQFVLVGSREQIGLTQELAGAFVTQEGNYFEKVRFDMHLFQSHIITQMLGIIVLFCVKSFQHYPTLGFHSWEKYPTDNHINRPPTLILDCNSMLAWLHLTLFQRPLLQRLGTSLQKPPGTKQSLATIVDWGRH